MEGKGMGCNTKNIGRFAAGKIALALSLLLTVNVALAVPVRWDLQDWEFANSMTVSGSFVFNADINDAGSPLRWTNIDITSEIGPTTFNFEGASAVSDVLAFVTGVPGIGDLTGTFALLGELETAMTNAGGTINLVLDGGTNFNSSQTVCTTTTCGSSESPVFLISGSITGSVVPVPAAVWLFGSALGLLGWMRRKAA
jgi:hypothetical protein